MTLKVQMLLAPGSCAAWQPALQAACDAVGLDAALATDHAPGAVDYVVYAPHGPVDLSAYENTKLVQGLWAGVETIVANPTLTQPYARMVDDGLREGMVEWVTGHVLRHHLGMDQHITQVTPGWHPEAPPLARNRRVTILGLGALGAACAKTLAGLNFKVAGWSRTAKKIAGVTCFSGESGLEDALAHGDILVLLLPATPATEGLLGPETLAMLPKDAVILNPGRGALIDDDALLAALDTGRIAHATLDTFRVEPLPLDHRYWTHARVTVTPHIASETRPETAAPIVADNIARMERGETPRFLVDKTRGY